MNGRRWGSAAKLPLPCAEHGSSCVCLPLGSQNLGGNHALHPVSQSCMHTLSIAVLLFSPGFIYIFQNVLGFFLPVSLGTQSLPREVTSMSSTLSCTMVPAVLPGPKPLTNLSFVKAGSLSVVHQAPREPRITLLAQCLRGRNHATLSEIPATKNSNCHKYRGQREMGWGCHGEKESSATSVVMSLFPAKRL